MNSLSFYRSSTHYAALCCLWLVLTSTAAAQKAPELGYVYPPTVTAGATHEVRLGGYDFTNDMQFFLHDKQATLEVTSKPGKFLVPKPPYWFGEKGRSSAIPIPREVSANLTVAKDHPAGLVRWQVANANGSSPTAVFYVSDTREVVEQRYRETPQQLTSLPIGVSGRLSKIAEVDRYSFQAERDGPITIELLARTLGSNFHGILEVRDSAGRVVADAADTEGLDVALTFAAKATQRYTVHLHDVDFRGNRAYVYRLAITPGPRVVGTIPATGQPGTTQQVRFIGLGLTSGQPQLETLTKELTFPQDATGSYRFRLSTPFGETPPIEIPLSETKEHPAAAAEQQPPIRTTPFATTSTLGSRSAEYVWMASKGDVFQVKAECRALGGRMDLELVIKDATGKQLATNDDAAGSPDPALSFKAPADGEYTCRINDLSGRAGRLDSIYRLSIAQQEPGYELSAPQQINLKVGGKATLALTVRRSGGHKAAIPIRLEGSPAGVTAPESLVVPEGKSKLSIALTTTEKCPAIATPIRIVGQLADEPPVIAMAAAAGNLCPRDVRSTQIEQILLTTTLAPAFSVELVDKNRQRAVHRGTTYPAPFLIKRDEGFTGEISLQMLAKQGRHRQGIDGPVLKVPQAATEILYPCYMPEWLETDRTTRMVVLGVGRQNDPLGNVREVTKQADARITMILEGALLRVGHEAGELTVKAGDAFEIPYVVSRSAKLRVPVKLELLAPDELDGLVRTESPYLELSPDEAQGRLRVVTEKARELTGRWPLTIKATALQDGRWLVVSQTDVSVQFDNAEAANND